MSAIPQIVDVPLAGCTVEDDGHMISLYVQVAPDLNTYVGETQPLRLVVEPQVDLDERGAVRGIEIILARPR